MKEGLWKNVGGSSIVSFKKSSIVVVNTPKRFQGWKGMYHYVCLQRLCPHNWGGKVGDLGCLGEIIVLELFPEQF